MRPGAGFNATVAAAAKAAVAPAVAGSAAAHSAWHSPVPYLFGGLAAMLGLIALALLILACSYWKLSGYLEGGAGAGRGGEDGSGAAAADVGTKPAASDLPPPVWEERILVIMAGDAKPTYLATPMSSRASSFGDRSSSSKGDEEESSKKVRAEEAAVAGVKDAGQNGEHSESRREGEQEHRIPEV